MEKISKIKVVLFVTLLLIGVSCQKEYEKEYSWAHPVSGDWTVKVSDGTDVYGPYFIKTYNSSFGQDSIWVDDNGNFWPFKAKAKVDMTNRTFETAGFVSYRGNALYQDQVSIANAKIVGEDSIVFDVQFASDPGTTYQISGHRRVSYDDYMNH